MNNSYDILEICLKELEKGADLDALLARYPEHAAELQPILQISILARSMTAAAPSADAIRRGRAKLMQRTAEFREEKLVPARKTSKRVIPGFQRLAITLSLTATLLLSGTGLVGASSNSLPGENLYPVKRTWEDVRLFFTFNTDQRGLLESEFDSERLHEVNELIVDGRDATTQFSGVFMEVNGKAYVSGIQVLISPATQMPTEPVQTGAAVIVSGHTNANGFVELDSIQLMPAGAVVPVGDPVEVETPESSSDGNSNSSGGPISGSSGEAQENQANQTSVPAAKSFQMEGTIASMSSDTMTVNNQVVYLDKNTMIEGRITSGSNVEVEGFYSTDGRFIVKKIKAKDSKSGGGDNSSGSNSGSGPSGGNSEGNGSGSGDSGGGGSGGGDHSGGDG